MIPQRALRCKTAWASLAERRICARQFHASISRQHDVPSLNFKEEFEQNGVDRLYSAQGYHVAWTQNMDRLIDRLNRATKGSDQQNTTVKALAIQLARNPTFATTFSTASMAHNNHFFFESLAPEPRPLSDYPNLQASLEKSFGSIDILRKTMLTTANAMHGPGFVWLVQANSSSTSLPGRLPECRIMITYNNGTPYADANGRKQDRDMNTVSNTVGSFGTSSSSAKRGEDLLPGTEQITPLLCVSTWEHAYLPDYGVGGKQAYLLAWWASIHWGQVDHRHTKTKANVDRFI